MNCKRNIMLFVLAATLAISGQVLASAEGCSPGFWKNHLECWCDDYSPDTLVAEIWGRLAGSPYESFGDDTLLDALYYKGGKGLTGSVRRMLRQAAAALLNGCSADVSYPVTDYFVIRLVNTALDTENPDVINDVQEIMEGWNEEGCPINAGCQ
jgi:hypothetical protein